MSSEEEDGEEEEGEEGDKEFTWSGAIDDYLPVGQGIAGYPNGDTFEGTYLNGKRQSVGKYTFTKSDAVYEGNYTNNQKGGFGTMTYPDKSIYTEAGHVQLDGVPFTEYTGSWFEDTRSGEGQYTYANGDIYKGGWSEDKKHGVGTYFFKNTAAQFIGDWEKGFFVKGKWLFSNGDYYEGDFAKSKPQGPGKFMFFRSKATVTGTFEKSKWTIGSTKQTPAKELLEYAMNPAPSLFAPQPDAKNLQTLVIPMKFK